MINQVTLVGRLTKDPDLRLTPEGTHVVNLTLAVNRQFKNQNGEYEADFVQCTLWRKTAENTANYCRKGSIIGITGRIHTRNYTNPEGKRVYITEVVAENVQFLSRRSAEDSRIERNKQEIGEQRRVVNWIPATNQGQTAPNSMPNHPEKEKEEVHATGAGVI
jgi:single-strand DNA-binding protein